MTGARAAASGQRSGARWPALASRLAGRLLVGLLAITLLGFTLPRLAGEDPVAAAGDTSARDQPWPVQYAGYLAGLSRLDLGQSTQSRMPVAAEIAAAAPASLALLLAGAAAGLALGLLLALFGGLARVAWLPLLALTAAGAVPVFAAALALLLLGSFLRPLPEADALVWPVLALAAPVALAVGRAMTFDLAAVLRQPYLLASLAAGHALPGAILRHGLRNALGGPLASLPAQGGVLVVNLLVVERLFSWPGLGAYLLAAIAAHDLPAGIGAVMAFAVLLLLLDAAIAALRAWLDPRLLLD